MKLVFDITASNENRDTIYDAVKNIQEMLCTFNSRRGASRSIDDINKLLNCGADKVSINTAAVQNDSVVSESSKQFDLSVLLLR